MQARLNQLDFGYINRERGFDLFGVDTEVVDGRHIHLAQFGAGLNLGQRDGNFIWTGIQMQGSVESIGGGGAELDIVDA